MKFLPALLLLSVIFVLSCDSGLESGGEEIEGPVESSYSIVIDADQVFRGVETEWNLSSGIVVLGPEDVGEPLARLELHLVRTSSDPGVAIITNAILSTSNLRSGPPEAIDARLYVGGTSSGPEPSCTEPDGTCDVCLIRSINSARVITGPGAFDFCFFEMVKVSGEAGPETITVGAEFTATDAE